VSTGRCWQPSVRDKDFLPSRWFGSVGNCIPGSQRARWQLILTVSHVSWGTRSLCRGNCGQRKGLSAPARKPSGILVPRKDNAKHKLTFFASSCGKSAQQVCVPLGNRASRQISCIEQMIGLCPPSSRGNKSNPIRWRIFSFVKCSFNNHFSFKIPAKITGPIRNKRVCPR